MNFMKTKMEKKKWVKEQSYKTLAGKNQGKTAQETS